MNILLDFRGRPSTAAFMARALWPGPRPQASQGLRMRWQRHHVEPRHLRAFTELTGLSAAGGLPLVYLHVLAFPLTMALLTHPRFPFPIWRVLQIRNRLELHRPLPVTSALDLDLELCGRRELQKGVELDLHTCIRESGSVAWESVNTFYTRRRAGAPAIGGDAGPAAPEAPSERVACWELPARQGLRFASLTGDYNGIHWWPAYARRLGFGRALHHPSLVLGQSLARLPGHVPWASGRVEAWLRGPVYDGATVELCAQARGDSTTFAVVPAGEPRAAVVGRTERAA
ncbi:MAG: hypothetical protein JNK82_21675 [Myxococcaceae bacterium]|nr:hypothetical protein [Myxococcaceae bacterium]